MFTIEVKLLFALKSFIFILFIIVFTLPLVDVSDPHFYHLKTPVLEVKKPLHLKKYTVSSFIQNIK